MNAFIIYAMIGIMTATVGCSRREPSQVSTKYTSNYLARLVKTNVPVADLVQLFGQPFSKRSLTESGTKFDFNLPFTVHCPGRPYYISGISVYVVDETVISWLPIYRTVREPLGSWGTNKPEE